MEVNNGKKNNTPNIGRCRIYFYFQQSNYISVSFEKLTIVLQAFYCSVNSGLDFQNAYVNSIFLN